VTEPDLESVLGLAEFEALARDRMDPAAFEYVSGGSWDEVSLVESVEAWHRHRFRPRVLVDVRRVDPSTAAFGRRIAMPVAVAPMALQTLAHPEGEVAAVRAAAAAGVPFTLSTSAGRTIEEVAAAAPDADRWFQLYLAEDLAGTRALVERAGASGYRVLVVTVDLPVLGYRERDRRSGFAMPPFANLPDRTGVARGRYGPVDQQRALGLTWGDLADIRTWSSMPVVLKGILTAEDAVLAVANGVDGIIVSNHGARQLDRSPAPIDVLEEVVDAVEGRLPVWVDGGVRRGLDVLIAAALGAAGVLVGRPIHWALAVGGEAGVARALAIMREELEVAMPLLGVASIADIGRDHLA